MNKLVAGYMVIFVIFTFLSSVMEGGGGLVATALAGALTDSATTITVDSTQGFLSSDVIVIGEEDIAYTGTTNTTFTGATRGFDGTTAETHSDDSRVFSSESGVLNNALGFNVASTGQTAGTLSVVTMTFRFLFKALPNLVLWDFSFFEGQLVFVRYLFMAVGVGLVVFFGVALVNTAQGIFRR